ncbi:MAG: hypothetical protein D6806_09235, partial [Deltaproteobacteria bacterium]
MRVTFSMLKGLEGIADKEGAIVGTVRWMLIDTEQRRAAALALRGRGISGEKWVDVADVKRVGRDVLFITSEQNIADKAPAGRDVRNLLGLPVTSLDGKRLGTLEDIVMDTKSWKIGSVVLSGGGEVDLGPEAVLGEDTVLLQKGAQDQVRMPRRGQSGRGLLDRVFGQEENAGKAGAKKGKGG